MPISSQLQTDASELTIKVDGRFDFSTHQAFRKAYEQHAPAPAEDDSLSFSLTAEALFVLTLMNSFQRQNVRLAHARRTRGRTDRTTFHFRRDWRCEQASRQPSRTRRGFAKRFATAEPCRRGL